MEGKNSRQQDLRAAPAFATLPGGARPRSPRSLRRASGTLDMRSSASDLGKCAPRKSHKAVGESTLRPRGANLVNPTLSAILALPLCAIKWGMRFLRLSNRIPKSSAQYSLAQGTAKSTSCNMSLKGHSSKWYLKPVSVILHAMAVPGTWRARTADNKIYELRPPSLRCQAVLGLGRPDRFVAQAGRLICAPQRATSANALHGSRIKP